MKKTIINLIILLSLTISSHALSNQESVHNPESSMDLFYSWGKNKEETKKDIMNRLPNPQIISEKESFITFSIGDSKVNPINLILEFNGDGKLDEATTVIDAPSEDTIGLMGAYFSSIAYLEDKYNGKAKISFYNNSDNKLDQNIQTDVEALSKAIIGGKVLLETSVELQNYDFYLLLMPISELKFLNNDFDINLKRNIIMSSTLRSKKFNDDSY